MSEQDNQKVVRELFDYFGRGDIPGMLGIITDDVVWRFERMENVPQSGERRGHEGVLDFFETMGANVEFESFEPQEYMTSGDKVIVTGREKGRVKATGKTFLNEWVIIFTVRDGKIAGLRCYEDTAAVVEAFRRED